MVVWVLNGEKVKSVATHLGSLGTETISKLSTFVFYFTKSLQVLGFLWLIIQYNDNIYCHHKWVSGYLWRWNCHRVSPVSPLSSDILPKVTGGHKWIARSTRNSFLTSNVSPNWVPTKHEMSQKASFDENADSCRLQNSQIQCMSFNYSIMQSILSILFVCARVLSSLAIRFIVNPPIPLITLVDMI